MRSCCKGKVCVQVQSSADSCVCANSARRSRMGAGGSLLRSYSRSANRHLRPPRQWTQADAPLEVLMPSLFI
jgi:hypothetical protein